MVAVPSLLKLNADSVYKNKGYFVAAKATSDLLNLTILSRITNCCPT